jgi:hypothetical protein
MITAEVRTRTVTAGEHLRLLRTLAGELERAMQAMARNNLDELEESVANQQELSLQLNHLADDLNQTAKAETSVAASSIEPDLMREIRTAAGELDKLNLRYSILLKHSSRSVAMMASLFNSFRGQIQEASGARLKQQTWSCQM